MEAPGTRSRLSEPPKARVGGGHERARDLEQLGAAELLRAELNRRPLALEADLERQGERWALGLPDEIVAPPELDRPHGVRASRSRRIACWWRARDFPLSCHYMRRQSPALGDRSCARW
jgi:hypothetical protein